MKSPGEKSPVSGRKQFNLRINPALIKATKILAVNQDRQPNEMMEEALADLLKKYKVKVGKGD